MGKWEEKRRARLGERFGSLVLEDLGEGTYFKVRCDCGSVHENRRDMIIRRNMTHCGCNDVREGETSGPFTTMGPVGTEMRRDRLKLRVSCLCGREDIMPTKHWVRGEKPHNCWATSEMIGKTFGRLTVVAFTGEKNAAGNYIWNCSCTCGNVTQATTVDLNRGNKRSCGCLQREVASARAKARFPRTEAPTYVTAHRWVWDTNGQAAEHECVQCGKEAQDWAYDGEDPLEVVAQFSHKGLAYSLNPGHYKPMCKPCHSAFDAELRRNRKADLALSAGE